MGLFNRKKKEEEDAPAVVPPAATVDDDLDGDDSAPEGLAPVDTTATQDIEYPEGMRLLFLMSSVFISMFLVSLARLPSPLYPVLTVLEAIRRY
jgi:hypothetical protein